MVARSGFLAASSETPSMSPPPAQSKSGPVEWKAEPPSPVTAVPPAAVADAAIAFVAREAVRQARRGASIEGGANEVLRWASRRRAFVEKAIAELGDDGDLDAPTRDAAAAILNRVLTFGLLF